MTETKPLIYKQLNEVMRAVGAIGKDSTNEAQKWKYRSAEAVINRLQPLLAIHGIVVVPQVLEEYRETGKTKGGADQHFISLKVKYTFYANDGSSVDVVTIGEAADMSDKMGGKAQTYAFKTALCTIFAIPTQPEDDPDKYSPEWARQQNGGITLRELNELKKEFARAKATELKGKSQADMRLAFSEFCHNVAGESFAVDDWQQWERRDLEACIVALNSGGE